MIWTLAVLSCVLSMAWPASGGLLTILVLVVGGSLFLAWDSNSATPERPAGASVLSAVSKAEQGQNVTDSEAESDNQDIKGVISKPLGAILLFIVFAGLMFMGFGVPAMALESKAHEKYVVDGRTGEIGLVPALGACAIFFRAGCLVFGGGPVVVPLLLLDLTS